MVVDQYGRQFENLRVSLTAACNYACSYCVPNGEKRHEAKRALGLKQLLRATSSLKQLLNLKKLRLTGGEPLIAPLFDDYLMAVAKLDFEDLSLTTNGQFLSEKLELIVEAGIKRINISLDTLDPENFTRIARAGDLATVLKGVEQCLEKDIQVKVNAVPLRSANVDQILPLLDFCLERGIELRFIELMRMGHLSNQALFERDYLPMDYLLRLVRQKYTFHRTVAAYDSTSARFEIEGKGFFGIIANESEPFCSTCTRLRLSSSGYLHGCLSSNSKHYIGDLLDLPEPEIQNKLRPLLQTVLSDKQMVFRGGETVMRLIGG